MEEASKTPQAPASKPGKDRRRAAAQLMHSVTPPEPEPDIVDVIDAGVEVVEDFLFVRW